VIAAFNAHDTISETIHSLRDAVLTFHGDSPSLIIVDDGSAPELQRVLDEAACPNLYQLVRLPVNKGLWFARNTGVSLVRTPYVTFVDADDLVLPNFFSTLESDLFGAPDAVATKYTAWYPETGDYVDDPRRFPKASDQRAKITAGCFMPSFSTIKRDVFLDVGGYRPEVTEDWDFWLRFFRQGHTAVPSVQRSYVYRVHTGSLSRRGDLPARDLRTIRVARTETRYLFEKLALSTSSLHWSRLARHNGLRSSGISGISQRIMALGLPVVTELVHRCLFALWRVVRLFTQA